MATTIPVGRGAGHFIAGESNFWRSREHVTLAAGNQCVAGTVLARVTASKKVVPLAPAATDGSQTAVGMLLDDCDATAEDKRVVLMARDFEADGEVLTWPSGITAPQKTAAIVALAALGIVVR
jgi:predicted RecA/RadA family phage recombinase